MERDIEIIDNTGGIVQQEEARFDDADWIYYN